MAESSSTKRDISPLAISALGFAAFLTILNLSAADRTPALIWASHLFAIGLPFVVFAVMASALPDHQRNPAQRVILTLMLVGTFLILMGIGLCFWEIAPMAGLLFAISILMLLILGLYFTYTESS